MTNNVEQLHESTVVARGEGILRICGERLSVIHFCEDDEQITLADCKAMADEQGYDEENDMPLLVVAEYPTKGAVYKHGNHLSSRGKRYIWEKVGETCGYA